MYPTMKSKNGQVFVVSLEKTWAVAKPTIIERPKLTVRYFFIRACLSLNGYLIINTKSAQRQKNKIIDKQRPKYSKMRAPTVI